jgi:two-component system response regulator VicR
MSEMKPQGSYTTGDVAGICNVTKRTVIQWIDSGKLKGYRIPGSTHRRVSDEALRDFLRLHKIPTTSLVVRPRILIVDDDVDLQELLKDALRERYDVEVVGSALEAASRLPVFKPDLVLLDIRLPDLSGLEVCRHFQDYKRSRNVPILTMSAFGSEIDPMEVRRSGADAFLPKPLRIADLQQRIEAMVG